jgi:hypothetical protein
LPWKSHKQILVKNVVSNRSYVAPNVTKKKKENGDGRHALHWGSQDMEL